MGTIHMSVEYVTVNCGPKDSGGCGLDFAMTRQFYDETKRTGRGWYCPNGHSRIWGGPSTEAELRSAKAREQHLADQLQASVQEAERIRFELIRDRHRFANGVCPCCNRSFENVARHMQTKHPDYDVTQLHTKRPAYSCSCGASFETPRGLRIHQGHARRADWAEPNTSKWRAHLTKV